MQRSLLLLLCALISAVAARATPMSKWPTIGTFATSDGGRATIFLDTHSITRHDHFWTARLRTLFTIDQKTDGGGSFRSEMDVYAYDCREARAALVSSVRYRSDDVTGAVVAEIKHSAPSEYQWSSTAPGSAMDVARRITCDLAKMAQGD